MTLVFLKTYLWPILVPAIGLILTNVGNMLTGMSDKPGKMRRAVSRASFTTSRNKKWSKLKLPGVKELPDLSPAPEAPHAPPSIPPAILIFWLAGCMTIAGCHATMTTYYRGVASAAVLVGSGYRLLDARDKAVQADIVKTALTDPAGAEGQFKRHLATYRAVRQALDDATLVVAAARAAGPSIESAANRDSDVAGWIVRLTALAATVSAALSSIGAQ